MGWSHGFLKSIKRSAKRGPKVEKHARGALYSHYRGLRCEPLESRCLLSLGAYSLIEGPAAGSDSDVVSFAGAWTAQANASWLHTSSSGNGNGLAIFSFDANTGATRNDTLTVAGATLTVTQAGSGYMAAGLVTLLSWPLRGPNGAAMDRSGSVYFTDGAHKAIMQWNPATATLSTIASGLTNPGDVAVDAVGNVDFIDNYHQIDQWNAAMHAVSTLFVSQRLAVSLAADAAGNVYVTDPSEGIIQEWKAASQTVSDLITSGLSEPGGIAIDAGGNIFVTNGNGRNTIVEWVAATQTITPLVFLGGLNQPTNVAVDSAGNVFFSAWVNTGGSLIEEWNRATWAVSTLVSSGLSGTVDLALDAAGNVYIVDHDASAFLEWNAATETLNTLVSPPLASPRGAAVDAAGNVYIADFGANAIKKWNAATQTVATLAPSGLSMPYGVAVDDSGNVYIADTGNSALKEWNAATQTVSTLVSSVLERPEGVAVDPSGNVYIANTHNCTIKEWNATTQTVSIVMFLGYSQPTSVALDASDNMYVGEFSGYPVEELNSTTQNRSVLISSGVLSVDALAVDGSGNVYVADSVGMELMKWNATTRQLSSLLDWGTHSPQGVAVDKSGNIYISDSYYNTLEELPRAFVPAATIAEVAAAGNDSLAAVLPANTPLTGVYAPSSDEDWLTIGSVSNGVVHFSFTQNTGTARTAHITLLGQQITVNQRGGSLPSKLGVFSGGYWYPDTSGDNQWSAADGSPLAFGPAAATPVAGDWDGSGNTQIGYYLNGTWYLMTSSGVVQQFTFGFTGSNVFPVVGDWNGDGKTEVGVYCNGSWFRDVDGSHTWDAANQAALAYLGWNDGGTNSVIPVPGHWAGDGKTEMGVYCNGVWFLDSTGSGKWDGGHSYWGWNAPLIPLAGNWSGSGAKDQFAVYNQGVWFCDADGTHQWDAANQAAIAYLGWSGAKPVVGNWAGVTRALSAVLGNTTILSSAAPQVQSPIQLALATPVAGSVRAGMCGSGYSNAARGLASSRAWKTLGNAVAGLPAASLSDTRVKTALSADVAIGQLYGS